MQRDSPDAGEHSLLGFKTVAYLYNGLFYHTDCDSDDGSFGKFTVLLLWILKI